MRLWQHSRGRLPVIIHISLGLTVITSSVKQCDSNRCRLPVFRSLSRTALQPGESFSPLVQKAPWYRAFPNDHVRGSSGVASDHQTCA